MHWYYSWYQDWTERNPSKCTSYTMLEPLYVRDTGYIVFTALTLDLDILYLDVIDTSAGAWLTAGCKYNGSHGFFWRARRRAWIFRAKFRATFRPTVRVLLVHIFTFPAAHLCSTYDTCVIGPIVTVRLNNLWGNTVRFEPLKSASIFGSRSCDHSE